MRLSVSCIRDYWSGDGANAVAYREEDDLDYVAVDRGIELLEREVAVFWRARAYSPRIRHSVGYLS
ncbi:MAG: hypothetical protein ACM3NN_14105 [Nitrospirota bacterium]|jgi:hypothetical protein